MLYVYEWRSPDHTMTHSPVLCYMQPRSQATGEAAWQSKLSCPLPEIQQYQSNFRTLSHDNSKTQQVLPCTKCRSHAHSISIAITCRASVGSLHNTFCLNDFCFNSIAESAGKGAYMIRKATFSQLEVSHALIRYSLLE